MAVKMYELDNDQPEGIDLPDEAPDTYRNQWVLENFLHKNDFPIRLDWGNKDMKFIVLIESDTIVGMSAVLPYKRQTRKVHLCAMFVVERLRGKGLGTSMLKRIVVMYPQSEITLSVMFDDCNVLNFYMKRGYAEVKSVNVKGGFIVLSLVNLKLLRDVSLPDE